MNKSYILKLCSPYRFAGNIRHLKPAFAVLIALFSVLGQLPSIGKF